MRILQVAAFAAEFPGNFIYSLEQLESEANKSGHEIYYAFPKNAQGKQWCKELEKRTKVFYLPLSKARIKPITYMKLKQIAKLYNIDIIHSHFELYDLPSLYASKTNNAKVIWHLHDSLSVDQSLLISIFNKIQYGFFGKNIKVITITEGDNKNLYDFGMKSRNVITIRNGINIENIGLNENQDKTIDFLTIGGNFNRKGIDIILKASQLLKNDGYDFSIMICCNENVQNHIKKYYNNSLPDWLEVKMPVIDVNILFKQCRVFIQASRYETFSFAVCEASYSGLDVIVSDIEGMKWSHELPTIQVFNNEDVGQLYKLMKNKMENKKIDNENIKETRYIIEQKYSSKKWADEVLKLYGK